MFARVDDHLLKVVGVELQRVVRVFVGVVVVIMVIVVIVVVIVVIVVMIVIPMRSSAEQKREDNDRLEKEGGRHRVQVKTTSGSTGTCQLLLFSTAHHHGSYPVLVGLPW